MHESLKASADVADELFNGNETLDAGIWWQIQQGPLCTSERFRVISNKKRTSKVTITELQKALYLFLSRQWKNRKSTY